MRIIHASDIQIRILQRHEEFRKHFENFFNSLHEKNPDHIVLTGDLLHNKSHLSAEQLDLFIFLLRNLSDIAPLHLIAGNHDAVLTNLDRLDSISPIVNALSLENIHYYKYSGVYELDDKHDFVVFSCLDEKKWLKKKDVNPEKINIGLYHGMVKGAVLQNGIVVEDCPYELKEFLEIVDYLMLGDIHKMQVLDEKYRSAYAGSLLQQNFGESRDKGYLVWDIESKVGHELDFIKLPSICPYYIIELPEDLKLAESLPIQEGSRIRVDSRQLTPAEENILRVQVEKNYKPLEIFFKDDVNAHKQEVKIANDIKIEDLSNIAVQEKLIREFLKPYNLAEELANEVCELNKKYDQLVRQNEEVVRNVQYKIKKIWWSNLFSYGEGNFFDFTNRKGIVGVVGPNGSGKTAFAVDAPLYAILNTNSKDVVKNDHLINDKKEFCDAKIEIDINDTTYQIKRKTDTYLKAGKRKGKPVFQGRTKVNFSLFDNEGNEISKDDEKRQDTDKEIRKIFGTAEDFLATSVTAQWKLLDFIQKKDTERQKIISRYFDVDSFEQKYKFANDDFKLKKEIFDSFDVNVVEEQETLKNEMESNEISHKELKKDLSTELKLEKSLSSKIEKLSDKIYKVDLDESKTEEDFDNEIQLKNVDCINKQNEIENTVLAKEKLEKRLHFILERIESVDVEKLINEKKEISAQIQKFDVSEISVLKKLIDAKDSHLEKLGQYTCTSNKDCCMLEEINRTKEEKAKAEQRQEYVNTVSKNNAIVEEKLESLDEKILSYHEDINTSLKLTKQIDDKAAVLTAQEELLQGRKRDIETIKNQKKAHLKNKKQIEKNAKYRKEISALRENKDICEKAIREIEKKITFCETDKKNLILYQNKIKKDKETYEKLKQECDAYFYFLEVSGKKGLSRVIVNNNLDIINSEISKILSGKVDFVVEVQTNELDKIDVYFKHMKSKARRIELCSGMEKSLAALAIRVALINVTTLPKSNILVLDEPFGYLEDEYKDAAIKILQYIKQCFDTVVLITHDSYFKDVVDHCVEVVRDENGFSKLV